jgi:photosystem II stability/assembly factor-like uncharacterized protein
MTDTRLYIGVGAGLFEARGNGSWEARPLGLMGKGGIRGLVVDAKDPSRLYAACGAAGVWRSLDGGRTWQEANEGVTYLEGYSLTQQPQTGELYYGSQPAAVFKSTDGGESWSHCEHLHSLPETLFWTFPQPPHIAHVKDIQVSPLDPKLLYGAVEEGWIIHSADGGQTWETLKQGVEFDSHAVTLMPDDVNLVITTSGNGIYRSENGGKTFERSDEGITGQFLPGGYMSPVAVHPKRPEVMFVGAAEVPPPWWFTRKQGANAHFYRSDDRGRSWKPIDHGDEVIRGGPRGITVDPEDPDRVFFGTMDGTVWVTEDGGRSARKILAELKGPVGAIRVAPRG